MRPQPVSFKKWLNKFRPRVEVLEIRSVPTVSVLQSEDILTITGTKAGNVVHISDAGEDGGEPLGQPGGRQPTGGFGNRSRRP